MSVQGSDSLNSTIKRDLEIKVNQLIGDMYAIISAGGEGVRLRPLTANTPKPLIEVGLSKRPLLYWSMLPMILGGVSHFIIGIRYGAEKIIEQFGKGEELSKEFSRKITIEYIKEPKPLGRAGFIKYGIDQGILDIKRPVLIFNASDILCINLSHLIRHGLILNICNDIKIIQVYTSGFKVQFGIGKVDLSTLQVTDFQEKPLYHDLANTAFYALFNQLEDFKEIRKIPSNIEDEVIHKWIQKKELGAYIIPHQNFISIKFEKDLNQVNKMDLYNLIKKMNK